MSSIHPCRGLANSGSRYALVMRLALKLSSTSPNSLLTIVTDHHWMTYVLGHSGSFIPIVSLVLTCVGVSVGLSDSAHLLRPLNALTSLHTRRVALKVQGPIR